VGSKNVAPKAPDYTAVAAADSKAAQLQFDLGQEQLDWAKDQYARYDPYVTEYLDAQTQTTREAQNIARQQEGMYLETYAPVEQKFVNQALDWNSPERAAQQSAMARADAASTIDAQRQSALTNLQSYGIDPSTTRYGALDAGYRISKAAAEAAAGTQARNELAQQELALEGSAIATGRGFGPQTAQFYQTSTQAGSAGTRAADTHFATGAGAMGSPTSYFGGGNTALGNQASAMNMGYNNALGGAQLNADVASKQSQGIGNLAGKLIGTALPFALSDRRVKRNIAPLGYLGRLMVYTYNYVWDILSAEPRYGFMADEVRVIAPEAVARIEGYDFVRYPLAVAAAMR
jgi:hypothetical protein